MLAGSSYFGTKRGNRASGPPMRGKREKCLSSKKETRVGGSEAVLLPRGEGGGHQRLCRESHSSGEKWEGSAQTSAKGKGGTPSPRRGAGRKVLPTTLEGGVGIPNKDKKTFINVVAGGRGKTPVSQKACATPRENETFGGLLRTLRDSASRDQSCEKKTRGRYLRMNGHTATTGEGRKKSHNGRGRTI